jgi:tetratricopeptide (TPR) repeat protein
MRSNLKMARACLSRGSSVLLDSGDKNEAIQQFLKGLALLDAADITPDKPVKHLREIRWHLLFSVARAYFSEPDPDFDQATKFYKQTLDVLNSREGCADISDQEREATAAVFLHLGDIYVLKKQNDRAMEYFIEAANLNAKSARLVAATQERMGIAFLKLGKRKEAHKAFQAVVEVDPDFEFSDARYVCYNLAQWYYEHKEYYRALKYGLKALEVADGEAERFPQTYLIHQGLGYMYFAMSLYEKAISHFRDSLRSAPPKAPERAAIVQHLRAAEKRLAEQESGS